MLGYNSKQNALWIYVGQIQLYSRVQLYMVTRHNMHIQVAVLYIL